MKIPPRKVTLHDVAVAAGVSIATASKVMNGRVGVSEQTRSRVREAAAVLGFVGHATRLRAAEAAGEPTIELILNPADVTNPYLATFLGGAIEIASARGYGLITRSLDSTRAGSPIEWAGALARAGRSGVIEVTSEYSSAREHALRAVGLPLVIVDPIDVPTTSTPSIGAANRAGAREATAHLLSLGHRRIEYIGGPTGAGCDRERAGGWAAAMADAGIHVDPGAVPRRAFSFEHGLSAATAMLGSSSPPTAIFAGSDISAMGVLEAARRTGRRVPHDLSVVGFDDLVISRTASPPLTTVHQPIADIGREAVAILMRLSHGESLATKRLELPTHLVVRESTAPPPGSRDAP